MARSKEDGHTGNYAYEEIRFFGECGNWSCADNGIAYNSSADADYTCENDNAEEKKAMEAEGAVLEAVGGEKIDEEDGSLEAEEVL